jgi:SAM-dependent methyltransferase
VNRGSIREEESHEPSLSLVVRSLVALTVLLGGLMAWTARDPDQWPIMVGTAFLMLGVSGVLYLKGELRPGTILVVAVLLRLFWITLPPSLSDDSYRYAWDGMIVAEGINPYRYPPADSALEAFHSDPVYAALNSKEFISIYPPASQYLFSAADRLADSRFPEVFFVWKGFVVILELFALLLLARMVSPSLLMLFAWSPLVLLEGAGQAHSDVLLALLLVVAVKAARADKWTWAGAAIALAASLKLWPALVVPVFLRHWRGVLAGTTVAIILAAPFWASFVIPNVATSLDLYVRYFEFNSGPYYALKQTFFLVTSEDWSKQLGPALRQVYLVILGGVLLVSWRRKWPLESVLFAVVTFHLLTATTVHPWYLYPVLLLGALRSRPSWGWHWLAVCSLGTYLFYQGGPYWPFVWAGWLGLGVLMMIEERPRVVALILRRRATWKAAWVGRYLQQAFANRGEGRANRPSGAVLDLGGGEGFVAEKLSEAIGQDVEVLEVEDSRAVDVPYRLYDGAQIPFKDGAYAAGIALFTLHHDADPEALLEELARVTRGPLVVVESVYTTPPGRFLLQVLDRLANGVRAPFSAGFKASPGFRTVQEWRTLFLRLGLDVVAESARYNPFHKKHLFCLVRSEPGTPESAAD